MAAVRGANDDQRLYRMFKALGNPVRLQVVRFIKQHPRCIANEIMLHLPDDVARSQATISQHLKVLRDIGLIEIEHGGPSVCYTLNRECMAWMCTQLRDLSE